MGELVGGGHGGHFEGLLADLHGGVPGELRDDHLVAEAVGVGVVTTYC